MLRLFAFLISLGLVAQTPVPQGPPAVTPAMRQLMDSITADSLRGDVSFLASDLLEGRDTPSRGLDIAAAYVASQFRGAGLEAVGDDGYYQTAELRVVQPKLDGISISFIHDGQSMAVAPAEVTSQGEIYDAFSLENARVVKAPADGLSGLTLEQVQGSVVLTHFRTFREVPAAEQASFFAEYTNFRGHVRRLRPALVVNVNVNARRAPQVAPQYAGEEPASNALRFVTVNSEALAKLYESLPPGPSSLVASVQAEQPEATRLTARNVVGLWRGGDEELKKTYVLASAHYDHVGVRESGDDRIFNGANDDASGTAGLIELAKAFTRLQSRPRRSMVFIAYFGEEKGMLGSRYYAHHPIFPLDRTVANLNLEHLGRVDDDAGSQLGKATLTGFDFSSVSQTMREAGALTGYDVYDRPGNAEYFDRSDNGALAAVGVPAHTLAVSFEFPDYHAVGDEWWKLNYHNMEKVVETAAIGLYLIADATKAPQWNEAEPKTMRYREERQRAQAESTAAHPR